MKPVTTLLAALSLIGAAALHAADAPTYQPETGSKSETSGKLLWKFTPDPALPNVLILGDSISIGYTLQVRELLQGKADVFRPTSADGSKPQNCLGTTFGVEKIDGWLAGNKWAVIHFNWGLHDMKHVAAPGADENSSQAHDPVQATVEEYRRNLEAIVRKLEATGAKLIFATTTPVAEGTTNPLREADAPARYNAAALQIMQAHGIAVDDLFTLCEPQLAKLQTPKNVHFKPAGYQALAAQVAATIETALSTPVEKTPAP